MTLPKPQPGLVIRYSYLWAEDAAQGREEGTKDRPAAVILVVDQPAAAASRVYVLPITHSAPAKGVDALEIPAAVARKAGLDAARSWVILSEFNEFAWPGFDLAFIPGRVPPTIAYGYLTPGLLLKAARSMARARRCGRITSHSPRRQLSWLPRSGPSR